MMNRIVKIFLIIILVKVVVGCQGDKIRKDEREADVDYLGDMYFPYDISFLNDFNIQRSDLEYLSGRLIFVIRADSVGHIVKRKMTQLELSNSKGVFFNSDSLEKENKSNKGKDIDSTLFKIVEQDFLKYFNKNIVYTRNNNPLSKIGAFQYYEILFTKDGYYKLNRIGGLIRKGN